MEELFENQKPLATIELSFLKKLSGIEAWNDNFYQIFQFLDDLEKKNEYRCSYQLNFNLVLIYKMHIFIKENQSSIIRVFSNVLFSTSNEKAFIIINYYDKDKKYGYTISEMITKGVQEILKANNQSWKKIKYKKDPICTLKNVYKIIGWSIT